MKIQKGHYVPKELITSEVVHEAVVKCFMAAGFSNERPHFGKVGNISEGDDGLGIWNGNGQPTIIWGIKGDSVDEPLTLQQLLTAENGLQWPTSAYRVVASDTGVWFDLSQLPPVVISGVYSGGTDARILATRQPKEKEVKTIEDAVIDLCGKWPKEFTSGYMSYDGYRLYCDATGYQVCVREEFEACAKRLGCINGYRRGVEYPTNGERPELPDDVLIQAKCKGYPNFGNDFKVGNMVDIECEKLSTHPVSFKITDPRFKPADTSYLNAPTQVQSLTHSEEGLTHSWHERGELPPAGWFGEINFGPYSTWCECVALPDGFFSILTTDGWSVFDKKRVLEPKFRPIRTEREKFIDAATSVFYNGEYCERMASALFDAGFRGPKVEK